MSDLRERLAEALTNLVFASSATRVERADAILAADPAIERTYQHGLDAEATIRRLREQAAIDLRHIKSAERDVSMFRAQMTKLRKAAEEVAEHNGHDPYECDPSDEIAALARALADTAPEGER